MNDELRSELRLLAAQVRSNLERESRNGRLSLVDEPAALRPPRTVEAGVKEMPGRQPVAEPPVAAAPIPSATPAEPLPGETTSTGEPAGKEARSAPKTQKPAAKATPKKSAPTPAAPVRQPPQPAFAAPAGAGADRLASKRLSAVPFPADDPRDLDKLAGELAQFGKEAAECRKCGLCSTRTKVVYGSGTARHPLLFVGEAPGFNEDQQGLPFVGQAGKLLTDIIAAMGFERGDVYIANLLKCRPPENRDPLPHEIESCLPWLERQIAIIQPRVICTLGKYSAQILTGKGPKATIGTLRGKVFHYNGIPVVPTYHPAFLLRSPSYKRATWEDVQLVRELYLAAGGDAQGASRE